MHPDSMQGSSKPKNRENCRSVCPIIRPTVKQRENPKWSLVTGRRRCFLHRTQAMETTGLWTKMCYERHRSLNEHSQSLRKRVQGRSNILHESKSWSPSFREKKISWRDGAGSLILTFTVGDFTQVQSSPWSRNIPCVSHRSHCLGMQFSIAILLTIH